MRVAIDARELTGKPTGVGRYLTEILRAWAALPEAAAHEFVLCAPAGDLPTFPGLSTTVLTHPGRGTLWEQSTLPRLVRRARADVLFAPAYTAPLRGAAPIVLAVHDVSFAAHPEWFGWREGLRRRTLTRLSARRAVRVLTISDFSKREIVRHLGVPAAKVEVIYPGVTTHGGAPGTPPGAARDAVLYVGSIFNRRHVPELIEGFALVAARHPSLRLEVVGDNRSRPPVPLEDLARATRLGDRIRIRSYVSDEELARLHDTAAAFAFLSDYEGFGLTPLDAIGLDIPVVVLDTDLTREVYGPAAEYVAHPEPRLIADALTRVLFDTGARARLQAAGRTVSSRYSWRACAAHTLQILTAQIRPAQTPIAQLPITRTPQR
jgi:glycosyltransferase involved in cell wall biosynthesis